MTALCPRRWGAPLAGVIALGACRASVPVASPAAPAASAAPAPVRAASGFPVARYAESVPITAIAVGAPYLWAGTGHGLRRWRVAGKGSRPTPTPTPKRWGPRPVCRGIASTRWPPTTIAGSGSPPRPGSDAWPKNPGGCATNRAGRSRRRSTCWRRRARAPARGRPASPGSIATTDAAGRRSTSCAISWSARSTSTKTVSRSGSARAGAGSIASMSGVARRCWRRAMTARPRRSSARHAAPAARASSRRAAVDGGRITLVTKDGTEEYRTQSNAHLTFTRLIAAGVRPVLIARGASGGDRFYELRPLPRGEPPVPGGFRLVSSRKGSPARYQAVPMPLAAPPDITVVARQRRRWRRRTKRPRSGAGRARWAWRAPRRRGPAICRAISPRTPIACRSPAPPSIAVSRSRAARTPGSSTARVFTRRASARARRGARWRLCATALVQLLASSPIRRSSRSRSRAWRSAPAHRATATGRRSSACRWRPPLPTAGPRSRSPPSRPAATSGWGWPWWARTVRSRDGARWRFTLPSVGSTQGRRRSPRRRAREGRDGRQPAVAARSQRRVVRWSGDLVRGAQRDRSPAAVRAAAMGRERTYGQRGLSRCRQGERRKDLGRDAGRRGPVRRQRMALRRRR